VPFETSAAAPRRIAVIGAGISGMGAAYHLSRSHAVTLFEAEPRLGGHARTVVAGKHGDQPVDTGFIVFNYVNYPHLTKLFAELDVPVAKSDMSFAASIDGGRIEYGLRSRPRAFRAEIATSRTRVPQDAARPHASSTPRAETWRTDATMTLGEFLDDMRHGRWFRDYYLTPISGAIWSTPKEEIMDFPGAGAGAVLPQPRTCCRPRASTSGTRCRAAPSNMSRGSRSRCAASGVDIRLGCPGRWRCAAREAASR
jgi:predicted NAD/FAD-binding protein